MEIKGYYKARVIRTGKIFTVYSIYWQGYPEPRIADITVNENSEFVHYHISEVELIYIEK